MIYGLLGLVSMFASAALSFWLAINYPWAFLLILFAAWITYNRTHVL